MATAPVFRAAGTTVFSPANNIASPNVVSPTKSGSTVNGDGMICVTVSRSNSASVSTPTGWTLLTGFPVQSGVASGGRIYAFFRVADGGANDAPTVSWATVATGTTGDSCSAVILSYSKLGSAQDGTVTSSALTAQTTTSTIPAITTGNNNSLAVGIAFKIGAESGANSVATFTERVDGFTTNGTGHSIEVGEKNQATAGTTGTATVTWGLATSFSVMAATLAICGLPEVALGTAACVSSASLTNFTAPTVTAQENYAPTPSVGMGVAVGRAANY